MKLIELKQQVIQKINELGPEAPAFFGKNKATITNWLKDPSKIPLSAIEPIIDSQEEFEDTRETQQAVEQGLDEAEVSTVGQMIEEIWTHIHDLNRRLSTVEQYAVPAFHAPAQAPQVRNPSPVHQAVQIPANQSIIETNPNEQNAGSMVRPGREQEMRVVAPRNPNAQGFQPDTYVQPQPAPVQETAMPPNIPRGGGWLSPHSPRRR